ncbi:hypothetical protein H1C71_000545 [Ictidomys tridecemlineatus]|nr:hypothetical protein H1C71_000545 [Ictidomys tridecemlineatus]
MLRSVTLKTLSCISRLPAKLQVTFLVLLTFQGTSFLSFYRPAKLTGPQVYTNLSLALLPDDHVLTGFPPPHPSAILFCLILGPRAMKSAVYELRLLNYEP